MQCGLPEVISVNSKDCNHGRTSRLKYLRRQSDCYCISKIVQLPISFCAAHERPDAPHVIAAAGQAARRGRQRAARSGRASASPFNYGQALAGGLGGGSGSPGRASGGRARQRAPRGGTLTGSRGGGRPRLPARVLAPSALPNAGRAGPALGPAAGAAAAAATACTALDTRPATPHQPPGSIAEGLSQPAMLMRELEATGRPQAHDASAGGSLPSSRVVLLQPAAPEQVDLGAAGGLGPGRGMDGAAPGGSVSPAQRTQDLHAAQAAHALCEDAGVVCPVFSISSLQDGKTVLHFVSFQQIAWAQLTKQSIGCVYDSVISAVPGDFVN